MSATEQTDASRLCFEDFQKTLDDVKRPFCSGTLAVDESNILLFYGNSKGQAARIDFANTSDTELQRLAEACDPVTLRSQNEEILDESHGKAGKLEEKQFATNFDVYSTGLMDVIRFGLLEGSNGEKAFRAEPYKLYVYDKGAFLTAHNYARTGKKKFGSLVIVFPTTHEGGSLLLRHGGKEWFVDSGQLVAEMRNVNLEHAHIVFVASFDDVEHEVTPMVSGYRVTLVYHLYSEYDYTPAIHCPPQAAVKTTPPETISFKEALSKLIQEPTFLPEGGSIGFGLYHQYPVGEFADDINDMQDCLKGRDAMIMQVCEELSLEAALWLLYDDERSEAQFLIEVTLVIDNLHDDQPYMLWALQSPHRHSVRIVERYGTGGNYASSIDKYPVENFVWARTVSDLNEITEKYIFNEVRGCCGNLVVDSTYANVCLVVDIGPPGHRSDTSARGSSY